MRGDLDKGWSLYRHRDFSGGENRIIVPERVAPNQLLKGKNCVFTGDGILQSRLGKTLINTAPLDAPVTSVHRYVKEDGTGYILVQSDTTLYAQAWDGATTLDDLTTGAVTKTVNAAKLRSVVWKNRIILTNGSDDVFAFDGAEFADLAGSPPKSDVLCIYAAKLWLVDKAQPNLLRFSGLEDPDVWDALDIINVRTGDGDSIVAISPLPGGLMIFKNNSTWNLQGFDRFDLSLSTSPIHPTVGAYNADSVVDGGVVYGGDNLYSFTLQTVQPLSETHRDVLTNLTSVEKAGVFAIATPEVGRVLYYIGNEILDLEVRYQGILSWDNLNAACFGVCNGGDDDGTLLVGDASEGYVYKLSNNLDDDGTAIDTEIWDSYRDYELVRQKVWRRCSPELETFVSPTTPVYYTYDVDFSSLTGTDALQTIDTGTALIWGTGRWGINRWAKGFIYSPTFFFTVRGNRISFRIKTQQRIRYYGYVTRYREVGYL